AFAAQAVYSASAVGYTELRSVRRPVESALDVNTGRRSRGLDELADLVTTSRARGSPGEMTTNGWRSSRSANAPYARSTTGAKRCAASYASAALLESERAITSRTRTESGGRFKYVLVCRIASAAAIGRQVFANESTRPLNSATV